MRYSAFISYSHRDRKTAIWLHRALETYVVPKRLRGRSAPFGIVGARLPPVFRDRDELAASADLGNAIREALNEADALIVVCSPAAAQSRWVNEEVRSFAALGRRHRIFCLIVDGIPSAPDPAQECLPPALREAGVDEPLASDVRPDQDGKAGARLKILAALLDTPYNELRQREAARHQRRLAIVAATSTTLLVIMTTLAIVAWFARQEALRQSDIARRRALTAERTVQFVQSMFDESDPSNAQGRNLTAHDVLAYGGEKIRAGLNDEPAVKAQLAATLAEVYGSIGSYRDADRMARWTFTIRHGDPEILAHQLVTLGESRAHLNDYEGAAAAYRRVFALCRDTAACGAYLPQAYASMAEAQDMLGNPQESAIWSRRALRIDLAELGANSRYVARDLEDLAKVVPEDADARALLLRALAIRLRAEGDASPGVSDDYNALGAIAYNQFDRAEAERLFALRIPTDRKVLGNDNPDLAISLNNLARVMVERRAFGRARPLLEEAVAIDRRKLPADAPNLALHLSNLALAEEGDGDADLALGHFEEALPVLRAQTDSAFVPAMADLAALRCRRGDTAGGLTLVADTRATKAEALHAVPWEKAWLENVEGGCLLRAGRLAEATRRLAESTPRLLVNWPASTVYGHDAIERAAAAHLHIAH